MMFTVDLLAWIGTAIVLFGVGFIVGGRGYRATRQAGARHFRLRDNAVAACLEMQLYRRVSAGLAPVAVALGLTGIPFAGAGVWALAAWGICTLYVWSRVAQVLTLVTPVRQEAPSRRSPGGPPRR